MAVTTTDGYRLPCGRDVEEVWQRLDEVEAGRADAHELDCPHCTGARRGLVVLRDLTGELAADDTEPSRDLTGRIMAAVRADVRRHDLIPVATPHPGALRVSTRAVAAVLRFAADSVPGVRARACRVMSLDSPSSPDSPTSPGELDEPAIAVELSLAVAYREATERTLDDLLADVRARVAAAAPAQVGVRLARLDLRVDDLYETGPS